MRWGADPEQREKAKMNNLFLKLYAAAQTALAREHGQSMSEYALAFSLIALGCVAGQSAVASSINHTFIALATNITANTVAQ